nr:unnamed protein product [Digitaria exilis]
MAKPGIGLGTGTGVWGRSLIATRPSSYITGANPSRNIPFLRFPRTPPSIAPAAASDPSLLSVELYRIARRRCLRAIPRELSRPAARLKTIPRLPELCRIDRPPRAMAMVIPSPASRSTSCLSASSCSRFVRKRRPCFLGVDGRGGKKFCYQSSPSSSSSSLRCSSPRAGSPPEYTPSTPPPERSASPDYTPSTPEYTPLTPSQRSASPYYTPGTPEYTPESLSSRFSCSPDYFNGGGGGDICYEISSPRYSPPRAASPEYTPSSQRGASPDYTPSSPSRRAASPEYTPATPEYTPLSPSRCPASPDYTPESPPRRAATPDPPRRRRRAATPEYTPGTPEYTPLSPSRWYASMDYTPESSPLRGWCDASPDTPSTPPPSPAVSDAESRISPARRRNH